MAAESNDTVPPAWQRDLAVLETIRAGTALADPTTRNAQGEPLAQHLSEAYTQLAARYPGQPEIQAACGSVFYDADQPRLALDYWQRAAELSPEDATLPAAMGEAALKLGRTRAAADHYRRAVGLRPGEARYHYALGNILYVFRRDLVTPPALPDAEAVLHRSLEEFRLAAQLAPASREHAQAYAETFYALARPDWTQALTAWQAVLALSGADTDFANTHLARVSLHLRQPEEARSYLERLRREDFTSVRDKLLEQARKLQVERGDPRPVDPPR